MNHFKRNSFHHDSTITCSNNRSCTSDMFLGILNKFTIDTQVNATESLIYLTLNVVALTVSHMKLTPSLSNSNFHSLKILSI